jgi:hypothetical protein
MEYSLLYKVPSPLKERVRERMFGNSLHPNLRPEPYMAQEKERSISIQCVV